MTIPSNPLRQTVSPAFGCGSTPAPVFSGQRATLSQPADSVRFGSDEKPEGKAGRLEGLKKKAGGLFKGLNFKAAFKGAGDGFVQYFKSKKGLRLDVIMHGALAVVLGAVSAFTLTPGVPAGAILAVGTFAVQSVGQILWRSGAGFFKNIKAPKEAPEAPSEN